MRIHQHGKSRPKRAAVVSGIAGTALVCALTCGALGCAPAEQAAEQAIRDVTALGFVDADGSKLQAIAVEYNVDIQKDAVSLDTYRISDYCTLENPKTELGENPGSATSVYVNDEAAISPTGGTEHGKYVIIEVNTDYQLAEVPKKYAATMAAGVTQTADIVSGNKTITASDQEIKNYESVDITNQKPDGSSETTTYQLAKDGAYSIPDIEGFELHSVANGNAFHATNCFDEATGQTCDVDLSYALYVPPDYDANGKYALALYVHDAGFMGESADDCDPMITLTESQGPANFASEQMQSYAREQGLDGIIVVAPQIYEQLRTTRDNYTTSAGVPATWQLLDSITSEYAIDMDHIYASGGSMGGMQVVDMAAQRDNYFAGIWAMGSQWGNNYDKQREYEGQSYYPSNDATIWTSDAEGDDSDYAQNWYYLISDDNILCTNCKGDAFSTGVWNELKYLYSDIADVELPYTAFNPLADSIEQQDAALEALLSQDNETGIYWQAFDGGSHMLTWVYGHKLDAGYKWLLSQNRQDEMARGKIEQLDRAWKAETDPAKIAAKQTDERMVYDGSQGGDPVYYAVPAAGAGTKGYNTGWYSPQGGKPAANPGWQAD